MSRERDDVISKIVNIVHTTVFTCAVNYAYLYERLRKKITPLFERRWNAKQRVYFAKRSKNLTTKGIRGPTICHNSSKFVRSACRAVRKWMKDDERKSKERRNTRNRERRRAKNMSIVYGLSIVFFGRTVNKINGATFRLGM